MSAFTPSHVFASITTKGNVPYQVNPSPTRPVGTADNENMFNTASLNPRSNDSTNRLIKVTAVGEVSLPPDRCRVSVKVHSHKDNVQDVKNSVQRRLDYILQTFQNHNVKVKYMFCCYMESLKYLES